MKPGWRGQDPRAFLLTGVALLVVAGLGARTWLGEGPGLGHRVNVALSLADRGAGEASQREFQSLLEDHADRPQAWFRAGRSLRELGRAEEATLYLAKAVELDSTIAVYRYELAKAFLAAGFPDDASAALGELLQVKPDHADGMYLAAALSASRRDLLSTYLLLERALDEGASDPDRFRWDPLFDPVRNEPRFLEITQRYRVPDSYREEKPATGLL